MSTHADSTPESTVDELPRGSIETDADDRLDELREYLDGLERVTVDEIDTHCCGALGCHRTDCRHWKVDVTKGRTRALCPSHAVDFVKKEVPYDV